MTIDTVKAKRALDHLQAERQAQQDRLQLAAQAKQKLDAVLHTHSCLSATECSGLTNKLATAYFGRRGSTINSLISIYGKKLYD